VEEGWGRRGGSGAGFYRDCSRGRLNKRVIGWMGFRGTTKTLARRLLLHCSPFLTRPMLLFSPDDPCNTSRLFRFLREVNDKHGLRLESYQDLYQWSISDIDLLWSHVWDHTGIIGNKGNHVVDTTATPAQNPCWFSDSTINYAENLLANRCPDTTAIVEVGKLFISLPPRPWQSASRTAEPTSQNPKPTPVRISNAQLYSLVADAVSALLQCGLVRGDRIASYTSNRIVS
jgi:acetoacetyl-CoA synthetase